MGDEVVEFTLSAIVLSRGGLLGVELRELEEQHAWADGRNGVAGRVAAPGSRRSCGRRGRVAVLHSQLELEVRARYRLSPVASSIAVAVDYRTTTWPCGATSA